MPNPETASTAGLIWLFPLTFLSNAFVPLTGMPPVIQTIAEWNPVSSLVLACRELFGNPTGEPPGGWGVWSLEHASLYTLISCVAVIAIFAPLAVRTYRRTTG
jgi:ABC-type multidrug transport system permease subunit